jgi:hypothetical protein
LISQDRHEIYITVAEYEREWLNYLKGEDDANAPLSFLKLHCFGPWSIFDKKHVCHLSKIFLDFTIQMSEEVPATTHG